MANQRFDLTIQAEGTFVGDRNWSGLQMHNSWNVENMNVNDRSEWGVNTDGWLQYRSTLASYAIRYHALDTILNDTFFETEISPGGTGNYELGVAFRFKDRNNYYYVTYNGGYQNWDGKNLRLMKRTGTSDVRLAEFTIPVFDRTKVYRVRVEVVGPNIKVWLDGVQAFNYTDSFPITSGAFGPIVKYQEFARWKFFAAKSVSAFTVSKKQLGFDVPHTNYDAATSKLLFPDTVSTLINKEVLDYVGGMAVESYSVNRFAITSSNPKTNVLFDKVPGKNVSTDKDSRIYAFQLLPTIPPIQVTNLQGSPIDHQSIKLQWNHIDDSEDGYHILDGTGKIIHTVGENSKEYIETGLQEGTTYQRSVVAFNAAGLSLESNRVFVTTFQTMPEGPMNFKGVALSDKKIQWSWDDLSDNENQFEVVDLSGNSPVVIRTLAKDVTTWTEEGLTALTEYTRAVRSKNTAGTSEISNDATVRTLDTMPDPPEFAPLNLSGVGVAHDSILWTWADKNTLIDGFYLYDENDVRVATIPKASRNFIEVDLLSAMEYRRKISAFNKGGEGPKTQLAWAKTLNYGQDQIGTPLEPFDLIVHSVTKESAVLEWKYNGHELMTAIGFKIYNELDELIAVTNIDEKSKLIEYLTPDTSYIAYVVAYNEVGDSLPSNNISWVTDKIPEPPNPDDSEIPEEWIDPYYGIEYDMETENTPRIPAFHSGVGDNVDLLVQNLHNIIPNKEEFEYEMYIKGGYELEEEYYPEVPFSFRVHLKTFYPDGKPYTDETKWVQSIVKGADDGTAVRYDTVVNMKPLPGSISTSPADYHVEFLDGNGKVLPQTSDELTWAMESRIIEEPVGIVEEIDMYNVFSQWTKFSHNGGNRYPASAADMTAWNHDPITGEIKTTVNSSTYMGAVSPDGYDNYDTTMILRSNEADNDRMGFVMAFAVDSDGKQYTLSAIRNHENAWDWAIWFNYMQPGAFMLDSKVIENASSGRSNWNLYYPKGTNLRISRKGDLFEAWASRAGEDKILEDSKLVCDLSSDPRLDIFKGAKPVGVSANSQANASLKITGFSGEKTRLNVRNYMSVWTKKKAKRMVLKEWKGAVEISDPISIVEGELLEFEGRIQSPQYQIPWQEVSQSFNFNPLAYRLVVTSKNPNVRLMLLQEVSDFFPISATFIRVKMRASIINKDQTKWHPGIHNGYYYFNQREHFLFSDDKVLPREGTDIKSYKYNFPYIIRAYAERHYTGGDVWLSDDLADEFTRGIADGGIEISQLSNTITLKDNAKSEMFVSRVFDYGRTVETWADPIILQDEEAIAHGAKAELEIGAADDTGKVTTWYRPGFMVPAERVRYRLSLKEGFRKDKFIGDFPQTNQQLTEGYIGNVEVTSNTIQIRDPELNSEGFLITRPIILGDYIDEMGTVELDVDLPEGSSIQLFSVTAMTAQHRFDIPTSTEPWIPLRSKTIDGVHRTYIIDSVPKPYLSIVVRLMRSPETPDLDAKSPVISDMIVYPKLYNLIRVAPVVDKVSIGGFISAGYWVEDYTVPLMGEVISDQVFHPISAVGPESIVRDHLASIGVNDIEGLTFKDYFAEVDPMYSVELKVDEYGKFPIEAKTTAVVGDIIYRQEKLAFDPTDNSLVVRPIPQSGTPIVIQNAQGKFLKQVHFRDELGRPTLVNEENLVTNETRNVFLQHHEQEIEKMSVKVFIELEKNKWTQIFSAMVVQNRLVLPNFYLPFLNIRISYRLKDTFYVDYNYAVKKDHALIKVNTSYDKDVKETTILNVKYEVNKEHAYYIGTEVNLNPLDNKIHSGFLYLTDELYDPYRLDIVCNPTTLYRSKNEKISVHAYVYDENGNPVVGEKVSWEVKYGVIEVKSFETDMSGMVTAIYEAPVGKVIKRDTIKASVIGRKASSHLAEDLEITIVDEKFTDKISLVPEKHIVQSGDTVQLKVTALGPSHERVMNKKITLKSNEGVIVPSTGITDYDGELLVEYRHPSDSDIDYVIIEAIDGTTTEQIILGISGV